MLSGTPFENMTFGYWQEKDRGVSLKNIHFHKAKNSIKDNDLLGVINSHTFGVFSHNFKMRETVYI